LGEGKLAISIGKQSLLTFAVDADFWSALIHSFYACLSNGASVYLVPQTPLYAVLPCITARTSRNTFFSSHQTLKYLSHFSYTLLIRVRIKVEYCGLLLLPPPCPVFLNGYRRR
jgi:hypothetical protein